MLICGMGSIEEIGRLTLWEYGAAAYQWNVRQPQSPEPPPPTAEEYWADVEELRARNDPQIRIH